MAESNGVPRSSEPEYRIGDDDYHEGEIDYVQKCYSNEVMLAPYRWWFSVKPDGENPRWGWWIPAFCSPSIPDGPRVGAIVRIYPKSRDRIPTGLYLDGRRIFDFSVETS